MKNSPVLRLPAPAFNPGVELAYVVVAAGAAMSLNQPLYVAIALAGAVALTTVARGAAGAARACAGVVVLAIIVACINPLFADTGDTVLFSLFGRDFHLEAIVCGASSGGLLAASVLLFIAASATLTSDKTLALSSRIAPRTGLMVSMVLALVPDYVRRAAEISRVRRANTCLAGAERVREEGRCPCRQKHSAGFAGAVRDITVLAGWGMEDALVRADSMRARGWGSAWAAKSAQDARAWAASSGPTTARPGESDKPRRAATMLTSSLYGVRFTARDAAVLAAIVALAALDIALALRAGAFTYQFYPARDALVGTGAQAGLNIAGYIAHAMLFALGMLIIQRGKRQ